MRQKIVAGNWKMNTDRNEAIALADALVEAVGASASTAQIVLCPPFVHLDAVSQRILGTAIRLGAQNVYHELSGAFTGEISTAMLRSVGCTHVIVGHSERRTIFRESDDDVAKKTRAALAAELIPIVCVGETLEERDGGRVEEVVGRQLGAVLPVVQPHDGRIPIVIAYEPVWAIGTGRTATPAQAQDVHAFIRRTLTQTHGLYVASQTQILYGGSVNAGNAAELFAQNDIDGGLIGGASLKSESFMAIVDAA
jgi:triosephosphate isomerase